MGMGRFSELVWATRETVPPTARERAERWIHALSGAEPVEAAQAEAEVQFSTAELNANWHEASSFLVEPLPHWQAGIEFTKRMFLGYGAAAAERIHKPREFESFLEESVAILSERTYRKRLQPYDGLKVDDAVGRAVAQFHQFVRTAVTKEFGKMRLAAWERQRERCQQKAAERAASVAPPPSITEALRSWCDVLGKGAEPAAAPPTVTEAELPEVPGEATPPETADFTEATANGKSVVVPREVRLQAFIHQHNTTIAAVSEAAVVHKPDMQHWRHDELSDDSVMSQRIENVLSGKTPLKTGDAKPAPAA